MLEQLFAENAFGRGKAIVHSVETGDTKSPIELIGLYRVGRRSM
jgi:hypothetical protein